MSIQEMLTELNSIRSLLRDSPTCCGDSELNTAIRNLTVVVADIVARLDTVERSAE